MTPIPPPPTLPVPRPKYLIVRAEDTLYLRKFIADLQDAMKMSRDTGGCYSAFLKRDGGPVLQVEVHLPFVAK